MKINKQVWMAIACSISLNAYAFNWVNAYVEVGNSVDGWKKKQVITLANNDKTEIDLKVIGWKKCTVSQFEHLVGADCSADNTKSINISCSSLIKNEEIELMLHGNGNAVNLKLLCVRPK
jgi:hypothetical protein